MYYWSLKRNMRTHFLKSVACYYDEVESNNKTFEIRDDSDRSFQKGDKVYLMCLDKYNNIDFSKKFLCLHITYVTAFKQQSGFVVFGFKRLIENDSLFSPDQIIM